MSNGLDVKIAIAGAAKIDFLLYELLLARLQGRKRVKAELAEAQNRRAKLAFCTGLMSEADYEDWRGITYVRNCFAHEWPTPTFNSPRVMQKAKFLSTYEPGGDVRQAFIKAVTRLAINLEAAINGEVRS